VNHERTHRYRFGEWRTYAGYEVRDPRAHRIGTVREVLADLNDEPTYVRVNMGLFGMRSVLIPVQLVVADTRRRVLMLRSRCS
jgi:sporulation protein YlmC with PRC-barrel domain